MTLHIGVLGPNNTTDEQYAFGLEVGRLIAQSGVYRNAVLIGEE